jgi:hypothetical protein
VPAQIVIAAILPIAFSEGASLCSLPRVSSSDWGVRRYSGLKPNNCALEHKGLEMRR